MGLSLHLFNGVRIRLDSIPFELTPAQEHRFGDALCRGDFVAEGSCHQDTKPRSFTKSPSRLNHIEPKTLARHLHLDIIAETPKRC